MFIGTIEIGTIDRWAPRSGSVISWEPTPASLEKAAEAPVSDVPVSYVQTQHLRGFYEQKQLGREYSRLLIMVIDVPGKCDLRAADYVVNAHLRRHATYRSWFEMDDATHIVRRTIQNPSDIKFSPVKRGEMSADELRDLILTTPEPLQWDCFRFGVIQGEDRHTFFASVDHVHTDTMLIAMVVTEFQMMYEALVGGNAPLTLPPAGSYDDYCVRERDYTSQLTVESPEVRSWVEFAEGNNGSFPDFPLPLGDASQSCGADLLAITLMDENQTPRFESACVDAGARFIGGILACAAMVERDLTGADTYSGLTPVDTRATPQDYMTAGWFTCVVPISVPIAASFAETARAAQESFDSSSKLANVPYYRVLELAPQLSWPRPNHPVINFFDAGVGPASAFATANVEDMTLSAYSDGRYSYQLTLFVARFEKKTELTVIFPGNPTARESIVKYVEAMKSMCARVADRRGVGEPLPNIARA